MHNRIKAGAAMAALLALLGGCSSSDGEDAAPQAATDQVPASASESPAGFVGYLQRLGASAADNLEPVDISTLTPPGADGDEPAPVDG